MFNVMVVGIGRIGQLISLLLSDAGFHVIQVDSAPKSDASTIALDIKDAVAVKKFFKQHRVDAVISCLPFYVTYYLAEIAKTYQCHYFDLTEDVMVSKKIRMIAKSSKNAFVPHCGLAPGLVGIFAHNLIGQFEKVQSVQCRVGGLPQFAHNTLHYMITWSVDGLINTYANPCRVLEKSKPKWVKPLEGIEEIEIDGMLYEAFNTSGGIGGLIDLHKGKVESLAYKTIRYPGHCEKMRFLMHDLKLAEDRETLRHILVNALPETDQDVVILDVVVTGQREGKLYEKNQVKKYYPKTIQGKSYSALQVVTAASLCAAIEVVLNNPKKYRGFVYQETLPLDAFQQGTFSSYLFD